MSLSPVKTDTVNTKLFLPVTFMIHFHCRKETLYVHPPPKFWFTRLDQGWVLSGCSDITFS